MSKLKVSRQKKRKQKATPQSRFNAALERYNRIQKQQQGLKVEIEALIDRVLPKIEASEINHLEAVKHLTAKLIPFLSKKTLPEYLREELFDWIESNFIKLKVNPASAKVDHSDLERDLEKHLDRLQTNKVEKQLKQLRKNSFDDASVQEADKLLESLKQAESFDEFMQKCEELFGNEDDRSEQSQDQENDQEKSTQDQIFEDNDSPMDDMFGFDDIPDDSGQHQSNFEGDFEDHFKRHFEEHSFRDPAAEQEAQLAKLLKKTSINKLFRRIARAIHPDLEQDEAQKKLKHTQMSELIEARYSKNIAKILDIYTAIFGSLPDDFPESDFDTLTKILNFKIAELRDIKFEIFDENPLYAQFYELFHSKTPKQEAQKIKAHCQELEQSSQIHLAISGEITSIKSLRDYLEARYETQFFPHAPDY